MDCPSTHFVPTDTSFLHEAWAWFAIGTVILAARTIVRFRAVGSRRLEGDDLLVLPVWLCFLCDTIADSVVERLGSNIHYTEDQLRQLSKCQLRKVENGSEVQFFSWYIRLTVCWCLKAMMLFLLYRLTFGLPQQRFVRLFALLTAVLYAAVLLVISCGCTPIQRNWQTLPLTPRKCTTRAQSLYAVAILSSANDAIILLVPIPLLFGIRISMWRKVGLTLLLCLGLFVMAVAVISMTYMPMAKVSTMHLNRWAARVTVAMIGAVNMPLILSIFRKEFWRSNHGSAELVWPATSPRKALHQRKSTIGSSPLFKRASSRRATLMEIAALSHMSQLERSSKYTTKDTETLSSFAEDLEKSESGLMPATDLSSAIESQHSFEKHHRAHTSISIPEPLILRQQKLDYEDRDVERHWRWGRCISKSLACHA